MDYIDEQKSSSVLFMILQYIETAPYIHTPTVVILNAQNVDLVTILYKVLGSRLRSV